MPVTERVRLEFYCNECYKYFYVKLNKSLNGNYRIHCPNCKHVHYRRVENGIATDERFPQNDDKILIEDIRPMKSAIRDEQEEKVEDNVKELSNPTDKKDILSVAKSFLRQSWFEKNAAKI